MADAAPTPADAVRLLAVELLAAVQQHAAPSLLVDHEAGAAMLGVSRSAWFRLVSAPGFPQPLAVEGLGTRFRRKDVEAWVTKLKPRRRKAIEVAEPAEV